MEEASISRILLSLIFLLPAVFFLWLYQSISISRIKLFAFLWERKVPSSKLKTLESLRPIYSVLGTFFFILFVGYLVRLFEVSMPWEIILVIINFLIFYIIFPWLFASQKRDAGISMALHLSSAFKAFVKEEEEQIDEEAKEGEVEGFIEEGMEERIIDREEGEILRNVIEFSDTLVREIMTPQREMIAVPYDMTLKEVAKIIDKEKKSRIPVYRNNMDRIEGVIYAKDLVGKCFEEKNYRAFEVMRKAVFVPESISISKALETMKEKRTKIAIVVDEYGVVSGLITMEDIVEEIIGEISEIDEKPEEELEKIKGHLIVEGDRSLWDLEDSLDIEFPEGNYSTVSGFIMDRLGRIAKPGEEFEYQGYKFKVLDADSRSIKRILIRRT